MHRRLSIGGGTMAPGGSKRMECRYICGGASTTGAKWPRRGTFPRHPAAGTLEERLCSVKHK